MHCNSLLWVLENNLLTTSTSDLTQIRKLHERTRLLKLAIKVIVAFHLFIHVVVLLEKFVRGRHDRLFWALNSGLESLPIPIVPLAVAALLSIAQHDLNIFQLFSEIRILRRTTLQDPS